ncbi:MAG: UvrD-helicase domain-containing protein [Candidatus Omnitrophica bacterium]|nr:UvrD-helicase domain-containing protein [Candidatus Omnitrophota bacterium]
MNSFPKSIFQFPEVRVVEASAGSGKTYALAKRYVQLLLNPALHHEHIPIRNILAITFTNKAAFEMKARILDFLKRLAFQEISQEEAQGIFGPVGIDYAEASQKAYRIMDILIHNYNFFQVQTIDKFINALLLGCAFKVNLTANFKIKTNSREYLQYSLDQMIDAAHKDQDILKIFENLLHNYLYLENRTGWFLKEDILAIVSTLFAQANTYGKDFYISSGPSEELIKKKKMILKDMETLKTLLPEGTNATFLKSFDAFLEKHSAGFDVDSLPASFATQHEVPARKNVEVSRDAEKLWNKIRRDLRALCEEEAYTLLSPYVQIFNNVQHYFQAASKQDDVIFLEELNKKASLLFDEDYITVEELYYRLATRFHHYLMDEFQDTSYLQWHNLEKMVEEALSTGGSLFYVGDRKQAIYGFRGGDVRLFEDVKQRFGHFNVQTEFLTNNWRSQKAIVEFNNAIFSSENMKRFVELKAQEEVSKKKKRAVVFDEEEILEVEQMFQGAQQTFHPQHGLGYVKVEYIDITKKEERDEVVRLRLVNLMKELQGRFASQDIAVLVRTKQQMEQVTTWLLEEDVLVDSERISNIQENKIVQELVAFLKFLNSPIDNLAFVEFVLGDVFAKASGVNSEELHDFIFSLKGQIKKQSGFYVYRSFREKYKKEWDGFIDGFFKNVGLYPLYELLVSVYRRLECLGNFPEYQGFLMHFLELVKKKEEDHSDIASFLDYFDAASGEDMYVPMADTDAVKVLTVHKSKGLEFPVVIIPFLGMDIQVGAKGNEHQQSYVLQQDNEGMSLLRLKERYCQFSEGLYGIYRREYKKAFLSELNNVYVALTRARYELYAFFSAKVGNSTNWIKKLIPEDIYERGQRQNYDISRKTAGSVLALPCAEYCDWIDYLRDEFVVEDQLRNREQRLKGEHMHCLLSFVKNLSGKDTGRVLDHAVEQASFLYSKIDVWALYREQVVALLENSKIKPFFYVEDGEVFTEKEFVNAQGHVKRLDRLVVKKDEVWVVDFKSTKEESGAQKQQVQEYMSLVSELYPGKKVKGFLVYIQELKYEEV